MPSGVPLPKLQKATAEELGVEIIKKLAFSVGKDPTAARGHDWLKAAILVVRDRVIEKWMASISETYQEPGQARLLPVDGIPHRAAASRCGLQSGNV